MSEEQKSEETASDEKTCFIVCPIGSEDSPERERSDELLEYIIEPVLKECGYKPDRSDKINESGRITIQIFEQLANADLVIGDLTDLNPNVMFELGYRMSLGLPVIFLAEDGQKLPFDTSDYRTIFYALDNLKKAKEAEKQLRGQVQNVDAGNWSEPIPVDFLSKKGGSSREEGERKMLLTIKSTLEDLSSKVERSLSQTRQETAYDRAIELLGERRAKRSGGPWGELRTHPATGWVVAKDKMKPLRDYSEQQVKYLVNLIRALEDHPELLTVIGAYAKAGERPEETIERLAALVDEVPLVDEDPVPDEDKDPFD